ncbi:MAG TPA: betaine/proline/choline family ABC transporter ATP-binding protein [Mogibacterium sp.]|nr:betaine/proline/choline family ABC transporter ATP-binding protein [Mogibacterium sp.]
MIEFTNVSKSFGDNQVLEDISIRLREGELTALIGPSGCGKTTMLKMINRMLAPTSGTIKVNGEDISSMDPVALRRSMGYVIQQGGLFPHLTIKENIEIIERLQGMPEEEISSRTIELMEMVDLPPDEFLNRYPRELSGGQQQRVGVARAFATDPGIILFDEPFSAIDPITRNSLQDQLIEIRSKVAKTMVFVTHDMDEAIKIADRICIIYDGRILQYDTPENILKNPANTFVEGFVGSNRIWSSPEYIKVKDFMITEPVIIEDNVSAYKCVSIMRSNRVDTLPVVDNEKKLLGIIGKKSFFQKLHKGMKAGDIMKPVEYTAHIEDSILDVLTAIQNTETNNVPVVDDKGRMAGLLTSSCLVSTLSNQFINSEENSEEVSAL